MDAPLRIMARMTEEEAEALDEVITNADITLKPGKGGIFTRQRDLLKLLDDISANYIMARAEVTRQNPRAGHRHAGSREDRSRRINGLSATLWLPEGDYTGITVNGMGSYGGNVAASLVPWSSGMTENVLE
jgi:hypothetical protein